MKRSTIIAVGVALLVGLLVAAGYLASTLWPKVVVVERKAVDSPRGPVGGKPGIEPFDDLVANVCQAVVAIGPTEASEVAAAPIANGQVSGKQTRPPPTGRHDAPPPPPPQPASPAAGFLVTADGSIVAASRALGGASSFNVALNDGRTLLARRVADDAVTGLTRLKIDADGLSFLRFVSSTFPKPGQWVAVVTSPAGRGCAVAVSSIAADSFVAAGPREDYLLLRPDLDQAATGAPVLDPQGRVIGIAGLGMTAASDGPIRSALPADLADRRLSLLGRTIPTTDALGVAFVNLTPALADRLAIGADRRGAYVASVAAGSPADAAGLQLGDVLVSVAGQKITRASDAERTAFEPGGVVAFTVERRGKVLDLAVAAPALKTERSAGSPTAPRRPSTR